MKNVVFRGGYWFVCTVALVPLLIVLCFGLCAKKLFDLLVDGLYWVFTKYYDKWRSVYS